MTYKDSLYFIAKCLTISYDNVNHNIIETKLKSTKIDWGLIVKLSTAHLVLPALYLNLKNVNFLKYLPKDLVDYMIYISKLNKERNTKIIIQVKKLNMLLNDNNIFPVFLKGVANLISGTYKNYCERMIGDIDFIVSKKDFAKAIKILKNDGYYNINENSFHMDDFRHYSPLSKNSEICSVEVHKCFSKQKFNNEFNYESIIDNVKFIDGIKIMSDSDNLILAIISHQINDDGYSYKSVALRNAYDVFLLSKKVNALTSINSLKKISHPLNCFLAICNEIFNNPDSLDYKKTSKVKLYLKDFKIYMMNQKKMRNYHLMIKSFIYIKSRFNILYKSIFYRQYRLWVFRNIFRKIGLDLSN